MHDENLEIGTSPSKRRARLAAGVLLCSVFELWAAPVALVNPGFEDISGESPFNEFTFGPLPGWDLYDPGGITAGGAGNTYFIGTLTPFEADPIGAPGVYVNIPAGAPEGQRVAIAFNFANSGGQGEYGLQQNLATTLAANTRYTLEVDVINIDSGTSRSGQFFDLSGFPGYRIDLIVGDQVVAQDVNSLGSTLPDGEFATSTVSFVSNANPELVGQALAIRLVNLNVVDVLFPASDLEVDFDNVRLTAVPVPVPPLLPLVVFAFGGLYVGASRSLRRSSSQLG